MQGHPFFLKDKNLPTSVMPQKPRVFREATEDPTYAKKKHNTLGLMTKLFHLTLSTFFKISKTSQ